MMSHHIIRQNSEQPSSFLWSTFSNSQIPDIPIEHNATPTIKLPPMRQITNTGLFDDYSNPPEDFYYLHLLFNILFFYFKLYGIHIIILSFLTWLTLFRKEISSNRVYAREERYCIILGKTLKVQDTERILDGTSYSLCGGPWILALVDNMLYPLAKQVCVSSYNMVPSAERYNQYIPFANDYDAPLNLKKSLTEVIPVDAQICVLGFLDVKDVISFSMVNKYTDELVNSDHSVVWKSLVMRDFSHVLMSEYMKIALNRHDAGDDVLSRVLNVRRPMKEFYFQFQLSWLNYILAGHNTYESCLVGIHGNALNITDFIEQHPGSPETILMHSGIDATHYFTTLNHSKRAQSIAHQKIILQKKTRGSLKKYYDWYRRECVMMETRGNKYCFGDVVGNVHVYFDVVGGCWRGWYTSNRDFLPVFIEKI